MKPFTIEEKEWNGWLEQGYSLEDIIKELIDKDVKNPYLCFNPATYDQEKILEHNFKYEIIE